MAWEDRIRQAAYTSPTNTRIVFDFENVSRVIDKRTAAFSFPGVDDNYIQSNGFGSRRYPLACIFTGPDHDITATAYEIAVLEPGIGKLDHPFYGTFDVVPVGRIRRRDDLKTAANQSIVEVEFWTSTRVVYPTNQLDARNELEASIDQFVQITAGSQFGPAVDVSSAINQQNLASTTEAALGSTTRALGTLASYTTEVNALFLDARDAINLSLDVLVGQPVLLAQQTANLLTLPARSVSGIADRLAGYANFAANIFLSPAARPWDAPSPDFPRSKPKIANDFYSSDLNLAGGVNAALLALVETQFETKPEAIEAVAVVLALFDAWIAWRDRGFETIDQIDTGEMYQRLQASAALAAGFVVEISFQLLPERSIVLDRRRTIVDLSAELFGSVSNDRLNDLITVNQLTGSDILELQRGREIVYYQ